jgi:hypothetical protein
MQVHDSLEDRDSVQLCFRNRACATVELIFVGKPGSQRSWGKLTVGKGKSLVRLLEVTVPAVQVPFPFRPDDNDIIAGRPSFGKETTLKSLLDSAGLNEEGRVIVVPTSREPAPAPENCAVRSNP